MRLKSIKLAGFKSFVDPTTVPFPGNMCAVVGPNGCGKSNVIDAVRWVMGESSAKNLRGESMADVIFNGSVNRQPVGQATIELNFDNSDGGVGGEYASYSEIAIRRQVTREGQSEYFLNGTRCRRRDITDIFLGTGLGPRSYAIIEQGMISRLVESKPEELRVFIEEAAGISKYKERRKETESRMRRTVENLERLTDLRDELERQLQNLQRQARAAERYREYKQEERVLRAQLLALQWQALDSSIGSAGQEVGKLEVKLEAVHAEQQQVDTAIEQHRVDHSERSDEFNSVQARYYSLGAEVSRLEQSIQHQQDRGRQLNADLQQTRDTLTQAESHLDSDREKLAAWDAELQTLAPRLTQCLESERVSTAQLSHSEQAMHDWQQQWDEFNQQAAEPKQQAEVQQSRIQHLEQVLQRVQARLKQLDEERQSLADSPGADELEPLLDSLAAAQHSMSDHESRVDSLAADLSLNREDHRRLAEELNQLRLQIQQLRGRQSSLEALQQAATADRDQAVGVWLQSAGLEHRPRLLEQLEVEAGWQLAVETVLGDYLKAVCIDDLEGLAELLDTVADGQLTLLEPSSSMPAAAGTLAARIGGSNRVGPLLAGVRTADDLEQALRIRTTLANHESVVTPTGMWLGPNWLRSPTGEGQQEGAIRRREELQSLVAELRQLDDSEAGLVAALATAEATLKDQEQQRQDSQSALQVAGRQHAEASAELSARQARMEQLEQRRERAENDISEARNQYQHEQAALADARQLLSAAIETMEADTQRRETLLSERDGTRSVLDEARQKARHDKDAAHQLALREQSLQTQLGAVRESIDRTDQQVKQLHDRRDSLAVAAQENDAPAEALGRELEQQLGLRLAAETDLSAARQKVADVEHMLREAERLRATIEQKAGVVRNELEQQRIASKTLQVQRDTIQSQLSEGGNNVMAVLEAMPTEANEAEWQAGLEKVGNRISRLGPINLAAIDEFELQSERKQYLDLQNEDLETALETLRSAIRKIDKETRSRFRDTFDRVNSGLQELFPRVFGGGSAYLEMTGDDLLDTGISIMARPPGKKNSTIHLLSGGEKALTAIALVFSIFQLNPAPFCMLDEVDAPLDDANVARFARMVKEMADKVQFIYITHNKISMELADQLMGVTMHEPGVSRLVTVDVEEAAELAAS